MLQSYDVIKDYSQQESPTFTIVPVGNSEISKTTRKDMITQKSETPVVQKQGLRVETMASSKKRRQEFIRSQSSMMCTSLRSSRLNLASVASELEFNQENADTESIDMSCDAI